MTTHTPPDVEATPTAPARPDRVPALAGRRPQAAGGVLLLMLVVAAAALAALRRRGR